MKDERKQLLAQVFLGGMATFGASVSILCMYGILTSHDQLDAIAYCVCLFAGIFLTAKSLEHMTYL